jgi:hypothetical protein
MEWFDEEDELYMETLELLQEARKDVDRKYPRIKENQLEAIMRLGVTERWFAAHCLMHSLERYLKDEEV